ncbi:MAG: PEGA domain-containing protein, partial [Methanosarcinales archaeon]|nr:PEGA domain-containing protein [Methanosarcinales archaeon]
MRDINKLIFLILFVLILSTPSQAATPVVSMSARVSPNVIEAGGSGVLTVTVSETGGGDWIKNPTVGILSYPDGLTFSGMVKTIPKIGKSSSDTFSFNFNTRESMYSGTGEIIVRLEYYEMDAFNIDTYGPYYKDSSATFSISPSIGGITVTSTPTGAEIYLDDSYKGTTPATLSNIPVGSHTIKLTKSGYSDISKTVIVSSGNTATVSGTLIQETGSIIVSSDPSGANVYLDGNYKGTSPLTINDVAPGNYKVKLTRNGYTDETISVSVKAGARETVSKTLKVVSSTVTPSAKVDSTPPKEVVPMPSNTPNGTDMTIYVIGVILLFLLGAIIVKGMKKSTTKDRDMVTNNSNYTGLKQSNVNDSKDVPTARLEQTQPNTPLGESRNTPVITSAFGYKGATIQYKVKVENPTSEPIADIKVNLYVPDVFLASESTRTITMLKPGEGKTATFEIRPTGECGDCEVSGKVIYYDYSTKKTSEVDIPAKNLSIVCPMLKGKEINESEWHNIVSNFVETEESTKEIDMPAETLFTMTSRIVKDMHMHPLNPEITNS